jgi:hypothetical protein
MARRAGVDAGHSRIDGGRREAAAQTAAAGVGLELGLFSSDEAADGPIEALVDEVEMEVCGRGEIDYVVGGELRGTEANVWLVAQCCKVWALFDGLLRRLQGQPCRWRPSRNRIEAVVFRGSCTSAF